jgi:hypothetical protein
MSTSEFKHVTTQAVVDTYVPASSIFVGLLREVRELSRKKPEATMSAGKVKLVNRVLTDLLSFLKEEPEGKYLEVLDDETLPQVSDALLAMVQFDTALKSFNGRYHQKIFNEYHWITQEYLAIQNKKRR